MRGGIRWNLELPFVAHLVSSSRQMFLFSYIHTSFYHFPPLRISWMGYGGSWPLRSWHRTGRTPWKIWIASKSSLRATWPPRRCRPSSSAHGSYIGRSSSSSTTQKVSWDGGIDLFIYFPLPGLPFCYSGSMCVFVYMFVHLCFVWKGAGHK